MSGVENRPVVLESLTIAFSDRSGGTIRIIEDLTTALEPGIASFAGRSGSGKTSILRAIAGLALPTSGRVLWWGRDTSEIPESEVREVRRTRLGYADQASILLPDLTLLENVMLPALPDGRRDRAQRRTRGEELLRRLDVRVDPAAWPATLSGGEKQRSVIARAMLLEPEVVIVDEPTASLDRRSADLVIEVLRDYADQGHVVVAASHDPHLIAASDQRIDIEREDPVQPATGPSTPGRHQVPTGVRTPPG